MKFLIDLKNSKSFYVKSGRSACRRYLWRLRWLCGSIAIKLTQTGDKWLSPINYKSLQYHFNQVVDVRDPQPCNSRLLSRIWVPNNSIFLKVLFRISLNPCLFIAIQTAKVSYSDFLLVVTLMWLYSVINAEYGFILHFFKSIGLEKKYLSNAVVLRVINKTAMKQRT